MREYPKGSMLKRAPANHQASRSAPSLGEWAFLITFVAIGAAVRWVFLTQPMRYDEAYTFLNFTNQRFINSFNYAAPNNHILHTLLVKLVTNLVGNQPAVIRLPAFVAGVAAIPVIYFLCRRMSSRRHGELAAVVVAVHPYLVFFSTNARGYSLVVLLTLAQLWFGIRTIDNSISAKQCAKLGLIGALAILSIPTALFSVTGVFLYLFLLFFVKCRSLRILLVDFIYPCVVFSILFVLVSYMPVVIVSGLRSLTANRFVVAEPWQEFVTQIDSHLLETMRIFIRFIPGYVVWLFISLTIWGIIAAAMQKNARVWLLLPSMLVAAILLTLAKQRIPFSRTWITFIPILAIAADYGFTFFVELAPSRTLASSLRIIPILVGTILAANTVANDAIQLYGETGSFSEAPRVVERLNAIACQNDEIHAATPADWPVYFYLWYSNEGKPSVRCANQADAFYVVKKSAYGVSDLTTDEVHLLFAFGDAAVYHKGAP